MKYCGLIGFSDTQRKDDSDDVWVGSITERLYYGDVVRNIKRNEPTTSLNDDINIRNEISIIADPFAYEHFFDIKYIHWMGTRWNVKSVDVQRPRLILTVGGVYNGPLPKRIIEDTSEDSR